MKTYLNDKYFADIDSFNTALVPHKLMFFKDCQCPSLYKFLNSLSYNLNFNSSNYRWGKRYFSEENKRFQWVTSSDKKISVSFWDKDNHIQSSKEIPIYFTDDMLFKHFFSFTSKKRKIRQFYKLDNKDKEELKDYHTALENMYMVDNKTFGSTQQLNTNILLVDIDNYEDRHSLESLGMFLDYLNIDVKDLLFLEQNVFTGGLHTALVLPHKISNPEFYRLLMAHLRSQGMNIECNFINSILRFPLSFEYVAIKKSDRIFDFDEFIPKSLWEETFNDYYNNLNFNVCSSQFLNEFIAHTQRGVEGFNKWENYWKTKKCLVVREHKTSKINSKSFDLYKIYRGHRYETMSKLIPFCKMQGRTLDETVDIIMKQNVSSKDLYKWSKSKLTKNIKSFYDKCPDTVVLKPLENGFISNYKFVPNITKTFLESEKFKEYITNKFVKHYIEERNKHGMSIKNLSDEKMNILKKQIPYIANEIIGSIFYDLTNKKHFVKGINEQIGFQLPDSHLKAIQEQSITDLNIDSPLAKTSLQYLKKAILKALSLSEIKYRNRERNWMLGSCKSYSIKSMNQLYNLLNHLFNSIIKPNKFKQVNLKQLISYISLIEKQGFIDDEQIDEESSLFGIPIDVGKG